MNQIPVLTFCVFLFMSAAVAGEGGSSGGTRGGADPVTARKIELARNFVTLKDNLRALLAEWNFADVERTETREILRSLVQRDVTADIINTPYLLAEKCEVMPGEKHAASTQIGKLRDPICFDLSRLSQQWTVPGELLGLALHEHAHHFGYADSNALYDLITVVGHHEQMRAVGEALNFRDLLLERRAHVTAWTTLYLLKMLHRNFATSGTLALSTFPVSADEARSLEMLATELDQLWVKKFGAKRNEAGLDYPSALAGLLRYGMHHEESVRWFADRADELYTFSQE